MKFLLLMTPSSAAHFIFTVLKELGCENEQIIYFEDILDDDDKCYKSIKDTDNCRVVDITQVKPSISLGQLNTEHVASKIRTKLGKEILQVLESDSGEDWFVVCDHDYERMTPLQQIKKAARHYRVRLHLFFEIPFTFMGRKRTRYVEKFIEDFHAYSTLFKFSLDDFLNEEVSEKLRKINLFDAMYIAEDEYFKSIRAAITSIMGRRPIGKQAKLIYDFELKEYKQIREIGIICGTLPIELSHTIPGGIFPSIPSWIKTTREDVPKELPGSSKDGKEICRKLRELRVKFAEKNGLSYTPQECTHTGPCSGTCPACEQEAKDLAEAAAAKEAESGELE